MAASERVMVRGALGLQPLKQGERCAGRDRKRTPEVLKLKAIETRLRALRDEETGRLLFRRSDLNAGT